MSATSPWVHKPERGPGEAPLLPNYEFLNQPSGHACVYKIYHECNYLQSNEGNIDPVHLSFLHQVLDEAQIARIFDTVRTVLQEVA